MTKPVKENIYDIIFDVVRAVPKGRVTSYGAVAAAIGAKSGARMVGYAMNASSSVKPNVPAHRVLNRSGMLTGKHHFNPPEKMEQLLKKEGIKVKDDKVVDFDTLFWDPVKELL
jgi:methylated-DNA-protein-cysteine methyltransferase-like protein